MLRGHSYEGVLEASRRNTTVRLEEENMADIFSTTDKVQAHAEDTQSSGGSGSGYSDLSAMENETDEFGRRLLQHQRDMARVKALSGNQQAFRKARPKPRIADVLAPEERESRLREAQDHQRSGSGGSQESEPPVTVPREWGRRARKQPHWMRNTIEPSEPSENGDAALNGRNGVIFTHRKAFSGDFHWKAGEDDPVQSVEQTPQAHGQPPSTPPSSMRHMNTTLRHDIDSGEHDFSSASLLTSTPVRTRPRRKIDDLARMEMDDMEEEAVARHHMDYTSPNGALRRSSMSKLREQPRANDMPSAQSLSSRPSTAHGSNTNASRIPRRQRGPDKNQENVPPNGEAKGETRDRKRQETESIISRAAQSLTTRPVQRPTHNRNDSMSLLKKLARVSSMSPSPASNKQRDMIDDEKKGTNGTDAPAVRTDSAHSNHAVRPQSRGNASNEDAPELGPLRLERRPVSEGDGRNVQTKTTTLDQTLDAILSPQELPEAKTPTVTGAWVDTTLHIVEEALKGTTISRTSTQPEQTERQAPLSVGVDLRRLNSDPARTKSALTDILRESRAEQHTQTYGESTIQSLEDIVNPETDPTDPTITFDLDQAANDENLDDGRPLTQEQKDRRQESLAIEGMNKHLRSARTNIKDANRGLRRVENRIETVQDTVAPISAPAVIEETVVVVTKPGRFGFVPCDKCGGCYQSVWHALWSEFRSCFYIWDPNYLYRIRLTSLGLLCLTSLIWYILERILCSIYCHPFVTSRKFYDIDPTAPRFPFVIPTLLFRPFFKWGLGEDMYDYMWQALEAWWHKEVFERFITGGNRCYNVHPAMCAYPPPKLETKTTIRSAVEGVRTSRNEWVHAATVTGTRVGRSVLDAIDEAGSMWDDFEVESV